MIKFVAVFLLLFPANAERKTVQCSFGYLSANSKQSNHWFDRLTSIFNSKYACEIYSNPIITEYPTEDVHVTGTHKINETNYDVKQFISSRKTMNYFPRGLEKFFKYLNVIEITDCGLKALYHEDLQQFNKLVELRIQNNEMQVLEEILFAGNPMLKELRLEGNQIKFIHARTFENLNNLSTLNLTRNNCIDQYADSNIGEVTKIIKNAKDQCTSDVELYKLHQDKKRDDVKRVDDWKREALQSRKEILQHQKGNINLEAQIVKKADDCKEALLLHQQRIKNLEAQVKTFEEMFFRIEVTCEVENETVCNLEDVDVKDNRTFIDGVKNINNHEFTDVVIRNQHMPLVPKRFASFFSKITKLTITSSQLTELASNELENMMDLEVLKVPVNRIQKIDFVLPWTKLKILDLSLNKIESLSSGSFDRLTALNELYLDKNALTTLPSEVFGKLNNLQLLSVTENQLQVLANGVIPCPNKIQKFSMSNNKLKKIDVTAVGCLKTAHLINLSGNICIDMQYTKESSNFAMFAGSIVVSCIES